MFNFDNSYKNLPNHLFTEQPPISVSSPELVVFNEEVQKELGIGEGDFAKMLSGNEIPAGAEPIAQAYAGHQFGHLNILGDGRAVLLGEHTAPNGRKYDVQLKGSGRTPYSRGGDGRGTLYSMLREYVIAHAMDHLGIPTTKSLAVVETGETVYREEQHRGAVLTRIASSHIRVGTFVYVAMRSKEPQLKEFVDYVIDRHYPELASEENPYLTLVHKVIDKQADLIVNWLRVGFIHGVMNTDNMTISGETIDYGPCAFMDSYDPETVFSSIDRYGRYAFGEQMDIGGWNIARFAESLINLVHEEDETAISMLNEALESYNPLVEKRYNSMMAAKIGIANPTEDDVQLVKELLDLMKENALDYTTTFRNLWNRDIPELSEWYQKWEQRDIDTALMASSNPVVIPRNHVVEQALTEASKNNNLVPLYELMDACCNPYSEEVSDYFKNPPEAVDTCYKTYCGT